MLIQNLCTIVELITKNHEYIININDYYEVQVWIITVVKLDLCKDKDE